MFEPFVAAGQFVLSIIPRSFRSGKPRLNFIMVHYLYLIGWSIVGSIILFGARFLPYNDALFFAVGCATQSGLNTINVNDMYLYQQVTMMLIASVCNPIFMNTAVVFVRLYWFEKRFKHIVEDIREQRRSRAPTISQTKSRERPSVPDLEKGVNGRRIRVLHETTLPNGMSGTAVNHEEAAKFKVKMGLNAMAESVTPTPEASSKSSDENGTGGGPNGALRDNDESLEVPNSPTGVNIREVNPPHHREIVFADEIERSEENEHLASHDIFPEQQEMSKHIAFLERQKRNAKDGTTLRIPGPRGFDRGETPQEMDLSDDEKLDQSQTPDRLTGVSSEREREGANTEGEENLNADDHTERGGVKFDDQEHPGHRQNTETLDQTAAASPRSGISRVRSGLGLRHRRSPSHRTNENEVRGNLGSTFTNLTSAMSRDRVQDPMPYLSWQATTGRNSAFLGLTEDQREELGGIEYRALKTLAKILILYFVGFHLLGLFLLLPWILHEPWWRKTVVKDGVNPSWWAIFTSASLFNDLGLTLTPDSMLSFSEAVLVLLFGSFLIIIGNTGFPVMLRFVIWVASQFTRRGSSLWEEMRFLLDHPRRCFTLLFPSRATWWLFWVLVLLNGIDLVFFIILDLNDPIVTVFPPGYRVLAGWFQAASTRTAGFSVVNLYYLHPAIQVSYMIMMYISAFPVAISVRRTNVYEEKSLGIFGGEEDAGEEGADASYVSQHLRRQLSFDLWYIFLGFFIICIVEGDRIQNTNDYAFTLFSVLFEIVSAYGTVGLSLGYPGTDPSFSAQFRIISKIIIMAMMIRGRHRGLPYALDRAILLPSENLQKKEAEDANRRYARRGSLFAEQNAPERMRSAAQWSDAELDEIGLPRQNLTHRPSRGNANMTSDGGQEQPLEPSYTAQTIQRRSSHMSVASQRTRRRSRSLSRVIAGGLSAGPTLSKQD